MPLKDNILGWHASGGMRPAIEDKQQGTIYAPVTCDPWSTTVPFYRGTLNPKH